MQLAERFWSKVDQTGDCWLWTGATFRGYGRFWANGSNVQAHCFAYEQAHGPVPEGFQVDHRPTCPKRCVRDDHLRLATHKQQQENQAGSYRNSQTGVRGVSPYGERYQAHVRHEGRQIHVGTYDTVAEAEMAVIAKRNELFTHNDMDRTARCS